MLEIKPIKYVKKACMFCLTYFKIEGDKRIQKQEWFNTLEEAKFRREELRQIHFPDNLGA